MALETWTAFAVAVLALPANTGLVTAATRRA